MLVATQWPLKQAPNLQAPVWYGGLKAHWNYLRYGRLLYSNISAFSTPIKKFYNPYYSHNVTRREANQGAVSVRKTVLPGMAIPMFKIRRPNGRLIFNMEIAIRR